MHDTRRRSIAAMLLGAAGLVATPASGQAITLPSAEELALPGAECGSITPASEPAEDVFVMPTTGMEFTLPGSEPEAVEQLHHWIGLEISPQSFDLPSRAYNGMGHLPRALFRRVGEVWPVLAQAIQYCYEPAHPAALGCPQLRRRRPQAQMHHCPLAIEATDALHGRDPQAPATDNPNILVQCARSRVTL